jgi:hypothetical protein
MSNHYAIATVTATLHRLLDKAVAADLPGAHASMVSPDSGAAGLADPGVNIFLYQVSANGAWRNEDLPTRSSEGGRVQRSRVGIDLHYLFTFYGADAQFAPQRVLATVIRELHANPVLSRPQIEDALGAFPALALSNLATEIERVKFTQMPISLEELSKLWSVFFQTTYHLSVVYQGSVVLLDSEDSFSSPLPVRARNLYVETLREPLVEAVVAASGDADPILDGAALRIRGRGLSDPNVRVLIDGDAAVLGTVTDTEIIATPPPLAAGVHGLVVEHPRDMGTPAIAHGSVKSDVFPFVLAPGIRKLTPTTYDITVTGADVKVTVDPAIGKDQRAALVLNELVTTTAHAYTFVALSRLADTNTITFTTAGVVAGPYLVRIQVDGADSPLEVNAAGTAYSQPQVTM